LRDPTKELTVRVHDECNGSDVLYVVFPSLLLFPI
jgi:GTP cyclohydrolase II